MTRHISDLIDTRLHEHQLSRRQLLEGASALAIGVTTGCGPKITSLADVAPFVEVKAGLDAMAHWPTATHDCQVLISWGDPIFARAPQWHPGEVTALQQAQQFGDCNDFIAYMPLERGSQNSRHGLLCVNHEYTNRVSMFPDNPKPTFTGVAEAELMGHGHSVVEIEKTKGAWSFRKSSRYNRRITPRTPMLLTGPAAGHSRLQTAADPTGREVLGTVANCSGGTTPWHTVLSGEENIHLYFRGVPEDGGPEAENHRAMGVGVIQPWRFDVLDDRWILREVPREPNRFGWMVEIDPFDARSTPKKRTALGRFAHEGAEVVVDPSGHIVVLMGDDSVDQFVYRFVSEDRWDPSNPDSAKGLLDKGILYVARFDSAGVSWLPLVLEGILAEHFASMGDLLIETRRAAKLLGATPMDRPERISVHPLTGEFYVMLTKNPSRSRGQPANPRPHNLFGQILVLSPHAGSNISERWRWHLLMEAGPPETCKTAPPPTITTDDGLLCCPDNSCFDSTGRLLVGTDGASTALIRSGREPRSDGLFLVDTDGPNRGRTQLLFRAPVGAELTGPCFTPDDSTLFLGVQHPGRKPFPDAPASCWPALPDSGLPPRSSVIALTRQGGGRVL